MLNKKNSYLIFFCLEDLHLEEFHMHIKPLYNNKVYAFEIGVTYYIHGFDATGKVFSKIPFKLISLDDKEETIGDYYDSLLKDIDKYLDEHSYDSYEARKMPIGIYISIDNVDKVKYEELEALTDAEIFNLYKIKGDLLLPLSPLVPFNSPIKTLEHLWLFLYL